MLVLELIFMVFCFEQGLPFKHSFLITLQNILQFCKCFGNLEVLHFPFIVETCDFFFSLFIFDFWLCLSMLFLCVLEAFWFWMHCVFGLWIGLLLLLCFKVVHEQDFREKNLCLQLDLSLYWIKRLWSLQLSQITCLNNST